MPTRRTAPVDLREQVHAERWVPPLDGFHTHCSNAYATPAHLAALAIEAETQRHVSERETRLVHFQRSVRERVRAQAALQRRALQEASLQSVKRERCVIEQAGFTDMIKRNPQVVRGNGSNTMYQAVLRDRGPTTNVKQDNLDLLAEAVGAATANARGQLLTYNVAAVGDTALPGGEWNRDRRVGITLGAMQARAANRAAKAASDALDNALIDEALVSNSDEADVGGCGGSGGGGQQRSPPARLEPCRPEGVQRAVKILPRAHVAVLHSDNAMTEETRRQRAAQFLQYRRLFMDDERQRARDAGRLRRHAENVRPMKESRERQRAAAEVSPPRRACPAVTVVLAKAAAEEEAAAEAEKENNDTTTISNKYGHPHTIATTTTSSSGGGGGGGGGSGSGKAGGAMASTSTKAAGRCHALRQRILRIARRRNLRLGPLCACGSAFADAHPVTCANNCPYYQNYAAYEQALAARAATL